MNVLACQSYASLFINNIQCGLVLTFWWAAGGGGLAILLCFMVIYRSRLAHLGRAVTNTMFGSADFPIKSALKCDVYVVTLGRAGLECNGDSL